MLIRYKIYLKWFALKDPILKLFSETNFLNYLWNNVALSLTKTFLVAQWKSLGQNGPHFSRLFLFVKNKPTNRHLVQSGRVAWFHQITVDHFYKFASNRTPWLAKTNLRRPMAQRSISWCSTLSSLNPDSELTFVRYFTPAKRIRGLHSLAQICFYYSGVWFIWLTEIM